MTTLRVKWGVSALTAEMLLYDVQKVYWSATEGGSYAEATEVATRVALIAGQKVYFFDYASADEECWFKVSSFNSVSLAEGSLVATGFASPTYYVDGAVGAVVSGGWHHIAVTTDTGVSVSNLDLGRVAAAYGGHTIQSLMINSGVLTPAEIKAGYLKLARRVLYELDLSIVRPTLAQITAGQTIPGTDYRVISGHISVEEDAIAPHKKAFKPGATAHLSRPASGAYGTWVMEFLPSSFGNQILPITGTGLTVASADNDGYGLYWAAGGTVRLTRINNGGVAAFIDTSPVMAVARYEITVTRSLAGEFLVYFKGGVYSDWTLLLSGTDTLHTTSTRSALFILNGDRFYTGRQHLGVMIP